MSEMTFVEMVRMLGSGEFDAVSDEVIEKWDAFVSPMISKKKFGKLYNQAKAFLVCHNMKMAGLGENALGDLGKPGITFGASSVSDGGSSISFASGSGNYLQTDGEFTMTIYGIRYLQLRKLVIVPILISGEEDLSGGV